MTYELRYIGLVAVLVLADACLSPGAPASGSGVGLGIDSTSGDPLGMSSTSAATAWADLVPRRLRRA